MGNEDLPVEYDMSFSTNARINYLLWICNESARKAEPIEWLDTCKNLLKECAVSMGEEEFQEHKTIIKEAEEAANKYNEYIRNRANNKINIAFRPPREIFDILYGWELKLRRKLDKMGLLFRKSDDAYSAMV